MRLKRIVQTAINSVFEEPHQGSHPYILIDKRLLHVGKLINFNLYFHDTFTQMSLFTQSGTVIDLKHKERLKEIEHLFVHSTEKSSYEYFIEEQLQNALEDESISLDEKTDIIYTSTTELTNSLYANPNALENAQSSKKIVAPILHSILYNEDTIKSYIKIIAYDYYTHTHSLNVSIYALCLGSELGLDKDELTSLGRAALLHDLGKSNINSNIVNKTGELSQHEFEEMKTHPSLGYDIALSIGIDDNNILDGIRHHHEKLDGMGYPDRLRGDEITLFPRIIGVCDIFDALTTRRSYKKALSSYDAIYLMKKNMYAHLDINIVNSFIKMLHN